MGTDEAMTLGADSYALSYSRDHGVGFYLWEGRKIGANKAYLIHGSAGSAPLRSLGFMFSDDGVTGVTSAFDWKQNGQSYNLQGLPAVESQHGIVISNGRKYYN